MVTTVREGRREFVEHLWTWVQAVGLVYVIGFGIVLLGHRGTGGPRGD